jgi:uncharacterized protein (TIGR03435 family)
MADFATFLQRYVTDRPVVDRTGVVGKYDLNLRWTPDDPQPSLSRSQWPGLYTAIDEQLGLKLKATKAPVKVLVIEHLDMPSEN